MLSKKDHWQLWSVRLAVIDLADTFGASAYEQRDS